MKNLTSYLITLLIFTTTYIVGTGARPDPVLDTDGDELRVGQKYYISSAFWGAGGGGVNFTNTCPPVIFQERLDSKSGSPVTFVPSSGEVIHTSMSINIKFTSTPTDCGEPTTWKVNKYDDSAEKYFVVTGKVDDNSWFQIEREGMIMYKLVFRPLACEFCADIRSNVGRVSKDGMTRLALDEFPFFVVFVKAA